MGAILSFVENLLSPKPSILVRGRTYRLMNAIGEGGEATVYRCKDSNGKQLAVKTFYFSRYPPTEIRRRIDGFLKEARLLTLLHGRSPHFIRLVDYEYRPRENIGYMVMELGSGNLREYLQGMPMDPETRRMFWRQIVGILASLQDARVVHADIKPENLILVGRILKVTDLSLAFGLPIFGQAVHQPVVRGTIDYMAPEVFAHQTGFKSDVWSAGIILYEMTYGRPPYFGLWDRQQKVDAISRMVPINYPPIPDTYLLDIIQQCLSHNANARPNAYQLMEHPYTGF